MEQHTQKGWLLYYTRPCSFIPPPEPDLKTSALCLTKLKVKITMWGNWAETDQYHPRFTPGWLLDKFLLFACFKFHAQAVLLEKQWLTRASLCVKGAWEFPLTLLCQQRQPSTEEG